MGAVVALGSGHALDGFALAGATVVSATTEGEVLQAWESLPDEVGLLILSPNAAGLLEAHLQDRPDVLAVVMP